MDLESHPGTTGIVLLGRGSGLATRNNAKLGGERPSALACDERYWA
ncbi:MAG: hypothetical protein OXL68_19155 [Paracoccaceae bacterium]|nr:hypothetical protein [Paracoccaceae bacterium]